MYFAVCFKSRMKNIFLIFLEIEGLFPTISRRRYIRGLSLKKASIFVREQHFFSLLSCENALKGKRFLNDARDIRASNQIQIATVA